MLITPMHSCTLSSCSLSLNSITMSESPLPKARRRSSSKAEEKRRALLFSGISSPWFRRNLFLSSAMIHSENISVYELVNYYYDCSSYNVISLKECQGFIFNQDLFASPYQQQKTLANERKYRAMSFSARTPKTRSNSISITSPKLKSSRRHTLYHDSKPVFDLSILDNSAVIDDEDDSIRDAFNQFQNTSVDIDVSPEEEPIDEYEDNEPGYKVKVTEILVAENDDIFPI